MLNRLAFTRFIAAAIVVAFHWAGTSFNFLPAPVLSFAKAGPVAVSYFYVLSGFIMVCVYSEMRLSDAPQYWAARFARIYPIYLLGIGLCLLIGISANGWELLSSLLLIQAWQPGIALTINPVNWSLSVEIFFYLLFPLLIMIARRARPSVWVYGTLAVWIITQILITIYATYSHAKYPSASHDLLYYFPLNHLNSFLIGMSAGILTSRRIIVLNASASRIITLTGFALCFLGIGFFHHYNTVFGMSIVDHSGLFSPLFGLMIVGIYFCPSRITETRFAQFLGESSYTIYILQFPLAIFFQLSILPTIPLQNWFWTYSIMLIAISGLCFVIIERPLRNIIRKIWSAAFWQRRTLTPSTQRPTSQIIQAP